MGTIHSAASWNVTVPGDKEEKKQAGRLASLSWIEQPTTVCARAYPSEMCESELVFTDRKGFTRQTDHVGDGLRRSWRHSSNHNRLPRRVMSVARQLSAGSHPRRTQSSAQLVASQSRDPVGLSRPERKSGGITDAKTLSLMQVTGSASEKTILKFHLFGNVSGREFQSIRRILQWIADAYAPRVEFYCQEEFEETAANTIKKQATELGGEVLQHCNTEWLLYALLSDGQEALYFGTKNDILKWASAEFLYQGSGEGQMAIRLSL
ncbi:hypothetical protein TGME49_204330 [Toxoplasma gondii ME49]|uniref:Uncharacterized protein n=2 Tax=Toxoplasma gondii TaxID=5811 RepID=S8GDY3_TOXGM|nr:hypothetical protein TGME49_204330 [Toxoplasma gondii ME49]EPT30040.1 hypothetical protein TGME49_204330 [Toxoplasma gondii ME49]KYF44361.1 hypothetical protein TGARI_204330 [Toxoplasma gondii ARI]|eukprot:XP_018637312.1 hypothetical protein TGME49_204330 [Toxoplasma gondii ME49]